MSRPVVIFSADTIRGNIAARKLSRENFAPRLLHRAVAAVSAVAEERPRAFVFDAASCIPDELRYLLHFCESLLGGETGVVVLGNSTLELPWTADQAGAIFLPDPLDPEALVIGVTAFFVVSPRLDAIQIQQARHSQYFLSNAPKNLWSDAIGITSEVDFETQLMDFLQLR
ncbi:hypothetical protein DSUL_150106 [Desulfovibrionales bacterium]